MLELVKLERLARAQAAQLSGGQQQRVALARALVLPAGACCCSTSRSARSTRSCASACRSSSSALQREVGITFVYVTHDQEEALTMSDRIAVMNHGGSSRSARRARSTSGPSTAFVADFLGVSNLVAATPSALTATRAPVRVGDRTFRASQGAVEARAAR